jgi:hypothetical protein
LNTTRSRRHLFALAACGALALYLPIVGAPQAEARRHPQSSPASDSPASTPSPLATPSAIPTPTSPAFSTLDGQWEVVVQTSSSYTYSRFDIRQEGETITGTWEYDGKKLPLSGTYGGRQFKFTATNQPHDITLTGYIENASDMVGVVDDGSGKDTGTAFTASHRATSRYNMLPKRGQKRGS